MVWNKCHELYGENPPQLIVDRLNVELGSILGKHTMWCICRPRSWCSGAWKTDTWWARRVCGVIAGCLYGGHHGGELSAAPLPLPPCKHTEFITDGSYGCGADMPDKSCPECGEKAGEGRV